MTTVHYLYEKLMRNTFAAVTFTNEKSANITSAFWDLLISAGIEFELTDFNDLTIWSEEDYYRPGFHVPEEHHYALAVYESNISFCRCYEAYLGRKPFISKMVKYGRRGGYICHGSYKTQGRLVVGAHFLWDGHQVTVTSFKDKDHSLIACAYYASGNSEVYERTRIKKRYTISITDFAKARKAKKN